MEPERGVRTEGVRSVARAVELLQLFDAQHVERPLRDLAELTGLPKTTVVRLLATLEPLGLIATTGQATYGLGAGFLRWARLAQLVWDVGPDARAIMRELADACGETVNVYVRQDAARICIAQEQGNRTVRSVVDVGVPMTLSAGASAKVLLGGAPAEVFAELAAREPGLDVAEVERQVAAVAEAGYAVTHGERELGASAVAAPIRSGAGRVVAALTASGPTSRFTAERVAGYVPAVTRAAARISEVGLGRVEAFL